MKLPFGNCPYCDGERGTPSAWGMSPAGWAVTKDQHDAGHPNFGKGGVNVEPIQQLKEPVGEWKARCPKAGYPHYGCGICDQHHQDLRKGWKDEFDERCFRLWDTKGKDTSCLKDFIHTLLAKERQAGRDEVYDKPQNIILPTGLSLNDLVRNYYRAEEWKRQRLDAARKGGEAAKKDEHE